MANSRTPLLTAQWRDLAMLNFEIDPGLLAARVPAGCELDAWDGRTFVSVVGFMFRDTRLIGIPIPFHRTFEEVNLRFYVRRRAADGWRRGVVFIKEIVPRFAIARMARALYNEPYVSLPMSHEIIDREASRSVRYAWRLCGVENFLSIDVEGESALIVDGSEAEFIAEHYWGYTAQRDGSTIEYQVEHPRWSIWAAKHSVLRCDARALYGSEFEALLGSQPSSAFLAHGSPVSVHRAVPLDRK